MPPSVVALVSNGCRYSDTFKGDMAKDGSLNNVISLCENSADTCEYLCNKPKTEEPDCPHLNDRSVDGFPTFKCIANGKVMRGYEKLDNIKKFVSECNESRT